MGDIINGIILVNSMCGVFDDIVTEKEKGKDVSIDKFLLYVLKAGSDAVNSYTQRMTKKYNPEESESYKKVDEILDEILKKVFNKK